MLCQRIDRRASRKGWRELSTVQLRLGFASEPWALPGVFTTPLFQPPAGRVRLLRIAHSLSLSPGSMPPSMLPSEAPCISGDIACTPSNSSLDSRQPASELRPPKSAKRRAAEALLHRRYSSSTLAPDGGGGGAKRQRTDQQRPPVRVAACSDCAACSADCVGGSSTAAAWCSQDVALPPMDWPAALQSVSLERDVVVDQRTQCYHLPGVK